MNHFVWADLSTHRPDTSKWFYERVFGWSFHESDGYSVAFHGDSEVAGLFETPSFFKKIKMPHFWMSYIAVEDAGATADLVQAFDGAKVELIDDFYDGKVALIRDPQGAGFTIYDGGRLESRMAKPSHLMWNELHVSDSSTVLPFYERLFGWKFAEADEKHHLVFLNQEHIADVHVAPNTVKGKYEYWVCTFAVDHLAPARRRIEEHGGGLVTDEGDRLMMHDNSGEAFFYIKSVQ
ncbi:MAG: VOC family protein [Planctomycetota bacterium]